MAGFFRRFKICFIITAVLLVIWGGLLGLHSLIGNVRNGARQNTECTTEERVFDYAGVLTDAEEEKLRKLIAKRERQTGCDIVLVTLNESLKEYARSYQNYVSYDKFVMVYADNFYDEHNFGYDEAHGNGVLLLDNLYREDDGWAYSWLCTTGKAEEKYSSRMIDHLLEKSYRWSKLSSYYGYKAYVNQFYHDMNGFGLVRVNFSVPVLFVVSLVGAILFVISNNGKKTGEKTTTARTYVKNGKAKMNRKEDRFINKTVVQHRIQTNSGGSGSGGGGGGGHHVSSGGVSHGGGGHRH